MPKRKFLWLLPIVLVVTLLSSCRKEQTTTNIYGNSILWIKIADSSLNIESLEIKFTTKDIYGAIKNHQITYSKGGFVSDVNLSPPTSIDGGSWHKVYQGIDETDTIVILYKGKEYFTRGYSFSEQRCIEINLKVNSLDGEFTIINHDIEIIQKEIEISNNNTKNQQDYEEIHFFYPFLLYCDMRRNGTGRYVG